MEYLEGETLADRLSRSGQLTESETTAIALQLCDGLAEAHDKGMIHRDLKPANIFLANIGGQTDVVKILDFGLAVMASGDRRIAAAGTPGYMSPEEIAGDPLDGRSDIYAIGCVLYQCLVGQSVFPAPATLWGRVISICIGFVGVLFTGLYIALATRALVDTKQHFNHPNNGDDSPPRKQS